MHDIITRLRNKKQDEGFTLIELLVVVVIIGVLVAIAVPVYLNYRRGAADKSAQSDVRGAISAIEQYYADNNNNYPTGPALNATGSGTVTGLDLPPQPGGQAHRITVSDKTRFGYNLRAGGASYLLCATNTDGAGIWYVYDSLVGGSVRKSAVTTPSLTAC